MPLKSLSDWLVSRVELSSAILARIVTIKYNDRVSEPFLLGQTSEEQPQTEREIVSSNDLMWLNG